MTSRRRVWVTALSFGALAAAAPSHAQKAPIEELVVTAPRLTPLKARTAYAVTRLGREDLQRPAQLRLDDILRTVPGFTLFRRTSSLAANPTTQGVSLRGLGPNGAGRTLVTLDGVPLNDAFGGWVYWSALSPDMIGSVDVVRGGGAGAAGNQALAGQVRLTSASPPAGAGRFRLQGGSFGTIEGDGAASFGSEALTITGRARYFSSEGYRLPPADQRGSADVRTDSEVLSLGLDMAARLSPDTNLLVRIGGFTEERENGIDGAANDTENFMASARLVHEGGPDGISGSVTLWGRWQEFQQTFAAVLDDARTTTRVVLDQFDVPSTGYGAIGQIQIPLSQGHTVEVGGDLRYADGETNERFRNLGDGFTRQRVAGGEQLLLGGWVEYAGELSAKTTLTAGARLDYWETIDGVRVETDLVDGAVLRDDPISNQSDEVFSGRLGLTHQLAGALTLRAAAYSGFRLPTINEFFRPFRVGNDITEANPALTNERLYGLDAGMDWEPLNTFRFTLDYYRNWLRDGVGNVTIGFGPGFFPLGGFVPDGGSLRQRQNIDRIVADGIEAATRMEFAPRLFIEARWLWVRSRITRFDAQPELEGNRLAQVPRNSLSLTTFYEAKRGLSWSVETRYSSAQFEDDANTRRLDNVFTVNLSARRPITDGVEAILSVDNLFDARIEAGIGGDGLITRGTPRAIYGGIRAVF